jgi:uncharacterized protein YjbJ (UPF0337 family)
LDATKDYVQINWSLLKPKLRKHWGNITDDDMNQLHGKAEDLINVLRKRYGYGRARRIRSMVMDGVALAERAKKPQLGSE